MGLFKMMRPGNCAMAFLGVFIGAIVELSGFPFISHATIQNPFTYLSMYLSYSNYLGILTAVFPDYGNTVPLIVPISLAALAAFLVTGAGNVLNDYYDRKLDKKAHPERPIPSGEVSPRSAWNFALVLFAVGIIITIFTNWLCVIIALLNTGLLFAYEKSYKAQGLSGNFIISYLTASVFLFGGASVVSFLIVPVLFLLALLANVSREITKDIEDMEADKAFRRTFPIVEGKKKAADTAASYIKLSVVLSFVPVIILLLINYRLPLLSFGYKIGCYLLLVIIADDIFIGSLKLILKIPKKAQSQMKLGMLVSMLAFFLFGAIPMVSITI